MLVCGGGLMGSGSERWFQFGNRVQSEGGHACGRDFIDTCKRLTRSLPVPRCGGLVAGGLLPAAVAAALDRDRTRSPFLLFCLLLCLHDRWGPLVSC